MLSPLERRGKDVGAAYVPIDVSLVIHSSIHLFNSRSNLLRPLPLLTFLHSCILADLFVPIEQEPGCFFFCSRFCNRLETLIGLIEIRCPALRFTRVKKGITRRFYANPKEHLQRGKIPARLLRPPTPDTHNLPFVVSHTHIHVIVNCATPQCHGPYQSQYENNSRLNRAS
jgi:hypothetical protein